MENILKLIFLCENYQVLIVKFILRHAMIVSDNSLVMIKRQAIMWINDGH